MIINKNSLMQNFKFEFATLCLAAALLLFGIRELPAHENLQQGLFAKVDLGLVSKKSAVYKLNYEEYPGLVAAFFYIAQQESNLYATLHYSSKQKVSDGKDSISLLASYGKAFTSPLEKIYSLPNFIAIKENPRPGLAFWRNGSVLRSDILVLNHSDNIGVRDQQNLVFFAELQQQPNIETIQSLPKNKGLQSIDIYAKGLAAKNFLASLSQKEATYLENLDQLWLDNLRTSAPDTWDLLTQNDGWQRDAFGYYTRTKEQGKGKLAQEGEDINIQLERMAFAGLPAQSEDVIVSFGKDELPMPFAYFVSKSPKGSIVEILCPPSTARTFLSKLSPEFGGTRYQWLLDFYVQDVWVYLNFRLEVPAEETKLLK